MIARDLMTPNPLTVTPEVRIAEVWDLMREMEIRHVPVVDNGTLIGMLSDRDLGTLSIGRLLAIEGADALREELGAPVVSRMTADPIAVEPETDVADVLELLIEHRIGAVPVVTPDTREVVGIISYIDVLRTLQVLLEEDGEEE